jgi:hypothetical protein
MSKYASSLKIFVPKEIKDIHPSITMDVDCLINLTGLISDALRRVLDGLIVYVIELGQDDFQLSFFIRKERCPRFVICLGKLDRISYFSR